MAAFLNLLGKSKPAMLTSFYRRAPNVAGGLFCGARMTCPTHLHEWSLYPYIHPVNGNGNHFLLVEAVVCNSALSGEITSKHGDSLPAKDNFLLLLGTTPVNRTTCFFCPN